MRSIKIQKNQIFFILSLIISIFFFNISLNAANSNPDLITRINSDKKMYELSDLWYFKADDKPEYKDNSIDINSWSKIYPHFSWTDLPEYKNYKGYAWYRKNLIIEDTRQSYSLLLPNHYRGAQFFFNGILFYESRKFNNSGIAPAIIGKLDFIIIPSNLIKQGLNILSIRTGWLDNLGGFNNVIEFGFFDVIKNHGIHYVIWNAILVAINLFLTFYFLLIYFKRKNESYYLYFSGLALCVGLFISAYRGLALWVLDYQLIYYLFAYISAIIAPIMLLAFLHSFFKEYYNLPVKIFFSLSAFFILALITEYILTKEIFYFAKYLYKLFIQLNMPVFLYGIWLSSKAVKNKKPDSRRILTAMIIFTLSMLVSNLSYMDFYAIPDLIAEGFLFLTVIFASVLASRFAQVHTDLELAHSKLLVLDKMKDEFLSTTSHELRTPLHGIIGLADSMLDQDLHKNSNRLSKEHRGNIELMRYNAKRLSQLVDEILDFSKLHAGKVDLLLEKIKLKEHLFGLVSLAGGLVGNKKINLVCDLPDELPSIIGDKYRIEQIILNLIGNAVKFTDTGEIAISASVSDSGILIKIKDTGCGISKSNLLKIWNPYEQIELTDTRTQGGTGLGLAITQYLVKLHGGEIWAESELGKGSVFSVWLPNEPPKGYSGITKANIDKLERLPIYQMEPPLLESQIIKDSQNKKSSAMEKKTACILAVDDDPINLLILKDILTGVGYRVETETSGPNAIKAIEKEIPDIVILDIMLPEMSGYEVAFKIRNKFNERFIPIIMVTARNQMEDMVKGFIFGGNDYITKPFNSKELLVRIENQLVIRNLINMEKEFKSHLVEEKEKIQTTLIKRSEVLNDVIHKLSKWEKIITKDLNLSKIFLNRLMKNEVFSKEIETHVSYEPLRTIGGDVYDIYEYSPGKIRIFIADSTGHGINASLNTINIMTEYNVIQGDELSPSQIMQILNDQFCKKSTPYKMIFTCCIAEIDLTASTMRFASAGHPEQYFLFPGSKIKILKPKGPIIGFKKNVNFEEIKLEFPPGAILFLFSDGILNDFLMVRPSVTVNKREVRDEKQIISLLAENIDCSSMLELCTIVRNQMKDNTTKKMRFTDDDITLIAIRRNK